MTTETTTAVTGTGLSGGTATGLRSAARTLTVIEASTATANAAAGLAAVSARPGST